MTALQKPCLGGWKVVLSSNSFNFFSGLHMPSYKSHMFSRHKHHHLTIVLDFHIDAQQILNLPTSLRSTSSLRKLYLKFAQQDNSLQQEMLTVLPAPSPCTSTRPSTTWPFLVLPILRAVASQVVQQPVVPPRGPALR